VSTTAARVGRSEVCVKVEARSGVGIGGERLQALGHLRWQTSSAHFPVIAIAKRARDAPRATSARPPHRGWQGAAGGSPQAGPRNSSASARTTRGR
jgi:hypothetical protein